MSDLRQFGLIFCSYYLAVVALFMWHHRPIAHLVWIILALVFAGTLVYPTLLIPLKWLWDGILKILNYINTRLLFGILFFVVFTPIALFKKCFGKDSMGLRYDPALKTYRGDCRNTHNDLRRPF